MTNAPADLLDLRAHIQGLTGLSTVDVGIVGDAAHAATGGYHEGRSDLAAAGVLNTDYSVQLPRDRAGLTESASAMDIGCNWSSGRAAWLRFNDLFVQQLHANDPALAAVRATNYSPDGTTRLRTDREAGWSVVASSDVVDIHTHIEWYRDTEGNRQPSLDRINALIAAAISNQPAPGGTMSDVLDERLGSGPGGNAGPYANPLVRDALAWTWAGVDTANKALTDIQTKLAALTGPAPVDTHALATDIATELTTAGAFNGLTADQVHTVVKQVLDAKLAAAQAA